MSGDTRDGHAVTRTIMVRVTLMCKLGTHGLSISDTSMWGTWSWYMSDECSNHVCGHCRCAPHHTQFIIIILFITWWFLWCVYHYNHAYHQVYYCIVIAAIILCCICIGCVLIHHIITRCNLTILIHLYCCLRSLSLLSHAHMFYAEWWHILLNIHSGCNHEPPTILIISVCCVVLCWQLQCCRKH